QSAGLGLDTATKEPWRRSARSVRAPPAVPRLHQGRASTPCVPPTLPRAGKWCSLSPSERAGVRGKGRAINRSAQRLRRTRTATPTPLRPARLCKFAVTSPPAISYSLAEKVMKNPLFVMGRKILFGLLALLAATAAWAQSYPPPAPGDFGAAGPFSVAVNTFTNPIYPASSGGDTLVVSVYHPSGAINPALPTIFFAHGY